MKTYFSVPGVKRSSIGWIVIGLAVGYCFLFFLQRINLQTADIGRHIINGQVILKEGLTSPVLSSNFYSYTAPDFQFVNHHWLYGVLAYVQYQAGGFAALVIINALLATVAIAFTTATAVTRAGKAAALLSLVFFLPLFTQRTEVRPETLSLVLMAFSLWLIHRLIALRLPSLWFLLLQCGLSIVWVNVHLFFILNVCIVACAAIAYICYFMTNPQKRDARLLYTLLITPVIVLAGFCINPHGLAGVVAPFHIFAQYAYPVAENQSLWFFLKYHPQQVHPWYFSLAAGLLALSFLLRLQVRGAYRWVFDGLLSVTFVITAAAIIRLLPFFAIAVLPIFAWNISSVVQWLRNRIHHFPTIIYVVLSPIIFFVLIIGLALGIFIPRLPTMGTGVLPGIQAAAQFYQSLALNGPIFNNYDIGSYLIFHLYQHTRSQPVFIDNRPEHYPAEFIRDTYIAGQENESEWKKLMETYNFETIFFYRQDATTWAQPFLIRRLQDPDWVPIFVDDFSLILIKNDPRYSDIIKTYALPSDVFKISASE